jgi:hypothetical protein
MKKAMLWILAFTAAGGIFAQEFKFDGYFNSGLGIISTDTKVPDGTGTKTADSKIVPFGVDSEQAGYRFRLNGSYTNADATAGAKFRFQAQSKFDAGSFSLPYAYGWVSFLNKIFTVSGGLVDDGTWSSGGAILDDDVGEGLGVLIKISPLEGLNLGAGAYVMNQQSGGNNNVLVIPAGDASASATTDFTKINIPLDRLKYTASAGYTLKNVFKTNLTYRTANQAGDKVSRYASADLESFAGRDETSKLIFSAHVLAVKNLTAGIEAELDKLEDSGVDRDKDNIDFNLYETIGYKIDNLDFGLNAIQYFKAEKDKEYDTGLHFNPWISYAIGAVVPRLDLNYFLAGKALTSAGANPLPDTKYHREVFAYADNGAADDLSVFAIRPSVKFNIDKNTSVEIGDLIALSNGPGGAFGDAADANKASNFNNVFYLDFKWKF